jgi:Ca2+-binding RTX toxin-like protein
MSRRIKTVAVLAGVVLASALIAGPVLSHTETGGVGDDEMIGHDNHSDTLNGGPGCDDVKGLGQDDHLSGGNGGCDKVRGGDGWDDRVITWDDNQGGDDAYGGAGNRDVCRVDAGDSPDVATCEIIDF